ncbi:EAL domain-containing protein [Oceanobacillus damuensis]|uniref:EAL domain-containing protein n=1 Tax=Oceanobacillus damuensis TaxID=937928 RepID=UPI00082C62C5|nr:EAL-associated domain-containing protein [Oceanobacillus damuensis]
MDPLDILMNLDQVIPFYKPVISADSRQVIGYEVVAYFRDPDGILQDLDWFFDDSSIPDDFRLEMNNYIQQKAIDKLMEHDEPINLTFYYDADLLTRDNGEALLSILHTSQENGLDLNRIVVEIKDTYDTEQLDTLSNLIKYMKTIDVQISLHVEQPNGSLDRLATIKPNIVKVDVGFLKDDLLPHLYRDVHHSLSMLSRKIGATLLFKGISSYNQLNYAWRNGGQYYQGRYLKEPHEDFVAPDCCQEIIETNFRQFVSFERRKVKAQLGLMEQLSQQFKSTLSAINPKDSYDDTILTIGDACSDFAFRVYICNVEGIQLSSNAQKNKEGGWELFQEGRNKNWSWRPYFFENIIRMNVEKKGLLSDLYTDIEKDELIRTYSYPLSDELYVFLDIPYAYLYEQEGLL